MKIRQILLYSFLLSFVVISSLYAQESSTLLQLSSDTSTVETGQRYIVRIEVHAVTELWATNLLIQYDPQHIYVVGTKSGSPVNFGEMMREGGNTIFNSVNEETDQLNYAASMFNPANPVSGTGVIGTFEIVPLLAGTTQLTFVRADVLTVDFEYDNNGQRLGGNPLDIEFVPVLLELNITGDPATPPPEATATPQPTATIDPALLPGDITQEVEPTLINVTAAAANSVPETIEIPSGGGISPLILFSIVMIILAGSGLIGLFIYVRNKQK
jgi:hypothetical protein